MQLSPPVVVQVLPPGELVAVKRVIGLPPLDAGPVQKRTADALPRSAPTPVGGPGTVAGVTGSDGADTGLEPPAVSTVTVNV